MENDIRELFSLTQWLDTRGKIHEWYGLGTTPVMSMNSYLHLKAEGTTQISYHNQRQVLDESGFVSIC